MTRISALTDGENKNTIALKWILIPEFIPVLKTFR